MVFWTTSSRNTSSVCRSVNIVTNLLFPGEPDNSFSFFSVFLVFWTALSRKPQSVSGSVDNVQNYASWVGPTIRSCALSFHSLLDGIKSKNMHFASRWAKQFVHILFSFLDLLHERKIKNIKCPLY